MTYIITPYVFTSAVAAIMALMVAVIAWQRRPATGRSPLIGLMLAVSLWSAGAAMEYATIGIPGKLLWVKPEYIGVLCSPVFFFLLALEYTQQDHWLSPRGRWLLFAPPALVWLLVITNEHHGLIWPTITLAGPPGANLAVYGHGIVFWLGVVAYAYILMLIGTVLGRQPGLRGRIQPLARPGTDAAGHGLHRHNLCLEHFPFSPAGPGAGGARAADRNDGGWHVGVGRERAGDRL
jgi:hypothetical protein